MKVYIIAPAGKTDTDKFNKILDKMKQDGFEPIYNKDIINSDIPYHSNNDAFRANDLINAFNSDADIIWCLRGGYGSNKIISLLDNYDFSNTKKLLIGFSDITTLHTYLNKNSNIKTMHAAVLAQYEQGSYNEVVSALCDEDYDFSIRGIKPFNEAAVNISSLNGQICGGNLTVLAANCGTDCMLDSAGKILLLEDINEPGYKIDRYWQQLVSSKVINANTKAIILGDFTSSDNGIDHAMSEIKNSSQNLNIPCFSVSGIGHGEENHPLLFNVEYNLNKMDVDNFELTLLNHENDWLS